MAKRARPLSFYFATESSLLRTPRTEYSQLPTFFHRRFESRNYSNNKLDFSSLSQKQIQELKSNYFNKIVGGSESPVAVVEDGTRGRCLVARYDIKKGQLITAEKPFIAFPNDRCDPYWPGSTDPDFRPQHCDHCLKRLVPITNEPDSKHEHHHHDHQHTESCTHHSHAQSSQPKLPVVSGEKCPKCSVVYCSTECREEAHNQYHALECLTSVEDLKKLEDHCRKDKRKFPLMAMRLMARLLKEKLEKKESSWGPLQLLSYADSAAPEWKKDYEVFRECLLSPSTEKLFSAEWFTRALQIFYLNAINVSLDTGSNPQYGEKPAGGALFILSSLYNHSCAPNTETYFPNSSEWHVRAKRNIPAGQEILVSYVAPLIGKLSVEERREHLHTHYGFWCNCPRCRLELEVLQKTREAVHKWKGV